MQFLRSALFDLFMAIWTVLFLPSMPFVWAINRPSLVRQISRVWSTGLLLGLRHIVGLTYREIGTHNKVVTGPVLFACNHQSMWETIAFSVLIPDVAFVVKKSLFHYPIFGWFLKHSPMIGIDRDAKHQALRKITADGRVAIAEGRSLLIFPEGTRTDVYSHTKFQRGIALLYKELQITVIPVAVNSGVFWRPGAPMRYSGEITVSYLPAIPPGLNLNVFMARLEDSIRTEKDRIASELGIDLWINAMG